jgi:putative DNA methylase
MLAASATEASMTDTECVTRGDLPHWYKPGHAHFVTYRLANSIPRSRLKQWKEERQRRIHQPIPPGVTLRQHRERAHKLFYGQYDEYLDRYPNERWLEQVAVADVIRENLYHHHGSLYELIAWCAMPNHVHILIQPFESGLRGSGLVVADAGSVSHVGDAASIAPASGAPAADSTFSDEVADQKSVLSRIMHSLKSYTANRANEILAREGRFWQRESYDHWVRDIDELERIVDYIRWNPVAAGLCQEPREWRFSSVFDRYARDGSECGLVGWLRDDWRR